MTDPAVQAVAEALMASDRFTHGDVKGVAQVAVDAYRRKVLASHPDAERSRRARSRSASAACRAAECAAELKAWPGCVVPLERLRELAREWSR